VLFAPALLTIFGYSQSVLLMSANGGGSTIVVVTRGSVKHSRTAGAGSNLQRNGVLGRAKSIWTNWRLGFGQWVYFPASNNDLGSCDWRMTVDLRPPRDRIVEGNGNRYRRVFDPPLHDPMPPPLTDRGKSMVFEPDRSPNRKELEAYPTGTSTCVMKTSLWNRRVISVWSAVSKNRVRASARLARASSIDEPSLATSNSGHSATNASPSRSIIAVKRCWLCMIRVYNPAAERGSQLSPNGHLGSLLP
jgi:hypothetical protein